MPHHTVGETFYARDNNKKRIVRIVIDANYNTTEYDFDPAAVLKFVAESEQAKRDFPKAVCVRDGAQVLFVVPAEDADPAAATPPS